MLTQITHIKKYHETIVEVGAVFNGSEVWRTAVPEAVSRYRAGVRYFIHLPDEKALEVVVEPGGLYLEPMLRTVEDRLFDRKLLSLPEFPH